MGKVYFKNGDSAHDFSQRIGAGRVDLECQDNNSYNTYVVDTDNASHDENDPYGDNIYNDYDDDDDDDDEGCKNHPITKIFEESVIVYHFLYGKGVVKYRDNFAKYGGRFFVKFDGPGIGCKDFSAWDGFNIELHLLSFTPYTIESGGFSQDLLKRGYDFRS